MVTSMRLAERGIACLVRAPLVQAQASSGIRHNRLPSLANTSLVPVRTPQPPMRMRPFLFLALLIGTMAQAQDLLIDDFRSANGLSALGTSWQGFSDRVMGGRSEMRAGLRDGEDGPVMLLAGRVRLENNGGFIQVRLPLHARGRDFDANAWQGVSLRVRGQPGSYYLHLRNRDCRLPWQYYAARIDVGRDWQELRLPFEAFEGVSLRPRLDLGSLRSVAVVAYGEAFEAEVEVARLGFYAAP